MQARLLTALIAIQQQIQVQRARAPTLAVAGTAVLSFDSEQCVEQGARGQGRLQMHCGVDEIGLLGVAPGRRQVIRRYAYQPGLRQCSQRGQSGGKGRWYIALIATKTDEGIDHVSLSPDGRGRRRRRLLFTRSEEHTSELQSLMRISY